MLPFCEALIYTTHFPPKTTKKFKLENMGKDFKEVFPTNITKNKKKNFQKYSKVVHKNDSKKERL